MTFDHRTTRRVLAPNRCCVCCSGRERSRERVRRSARRSIVKSIGPGTRGAAPTAGYDRQVGRVSAAATIAHGPCVDRGDLLSTRYLVRIRSRRIHYTPGVIALRSAVMTLGVDREVRNAPRTHGSACNGPGSPRAPAFSSGASSPRHDRWLRGIAGTGSACLASLPWSRDRCAAIEAQLAASTKLLAFVLRRSAACSLIGFRHRRRPARSPLQRRRRRLRLLEPEHEERVTAGDRDVLLVAGEERHRARRIAPPVWNCHSGLPLFASSAKKLPSFDPLNTSPPAVDITPAQVGDGSLKSHVCLPVLTSSARTAPHDSSSSRFSLPPV